MFRLAQVRSVLWHDVCKVQLWHTCHASVIICLADQQILVCFVSAVKSGFSLAAGFVKNLHLNQTLLTTFIAYCAWLVRTKSRLRVILLAVTDNFFIDSPLYFAP